MPRDPFATEAGTPLHLRDEDLDARKRAVYVAFLALAASAAVFSFGANVARATPDPFVGWIQAATAGLLFGGAGLVRFGRVPTAVLERAGLVFGGLGIVVSLAVATYAVPDHLGRSAAQATLHWVPLVFAFAFVAFPGRVAARAALALLAVVAAVVLPHDVARWLEGDGDHLYLLGQALASYAVLVAALRFFADLHVRATTFQRAAERMRELAHTDTLTRLGNRRQADAWLQREVRRAERYGRPLSVLMLDLDHFKRLNDAHGHGAGDRVLVDLGRHLAASVRGSDAVVRWGGEEFLVLAPETVLEDAVHLADGIRRGVAREPFGDGHRLTVSVGVASHRRGDDPASLVARADAALYMAKRAGRNAVRQEIAAPS